MKRSLILIIFSMVLCGIFLLLATRESIDGYHGRTSAILAASLSGRGDDYVYVAPVDTERLTFREKDGAGGEPLALPLCPGKTNETP